MVTLTDSGLEASTLFGKTRRLVLSLLFMNPGRSYYLRQIVKLTGAGLGPVQRDLRKLTEAGLVVHKKDGLQVYWQANSKSPIFNEIRSIIVKTTGLADILRKSLAKLTGSIKAAFLFGSYARGKDHPSSDIDILVVGDVKLLEVIKAIRPYRENLMREVNPIVISEAEFFNKVKAGNNFIGQIWDGPKIWLVGDKDDLKDMG